MPTNELLACPFCGGEPTVDEFTEMDHKPAVAISCDKCNMAGTLTCFTLEEALGYWNRRTVPPTEAMLRAEYNRGYEVCRGTKLPPALAPVAVPREARERPRAQGMLVCPACQKVTRADDIHTCTPVGAEAVGALTDAECDAIESAATGKPLNITTRADALQYARAMIRAALRAAPTAAPVREAAWLIERGQEEGQVPTVWWCLPAYGDYKYGGRWTEDANKAHRFDSFSAASRPYDGAGGLSVATDAPVNGDGDLLLAHATEHVFLNIDRAEEKP